MWDNKCLYYIRQRLTDQVVIYSAKMQRPLGTVLTLLSAVVLFSVTQQATAELAENAYAKCDMNQIEQLFQNLFNEARYEYYQLVQMLDQLQNETRQVKQLLLQPQHDQSPNVITGKYRVDQKMF